jgi:hypothetical protein
MRKEEVWMVCDAYESGYGDGYGKRNHTNPHAKGTDQWEGWAYGYSEGARKRAAHDLQVTVG